MKIKMIKSDYSFIDREIEFKNLGEAISHFLTPDAYSYDGKKQELEERINKQEILISNLIVILYNHNILDVNKLNILFDNKYTIEDDKNDS